MRCGARFVVFMAISTFTKSVDSVVAVGAVGAGGGESSSTCFPLDFLDLFGRVFLLVLFMSELRREGKEGSCCK